MIDRDLARNGQRWRIAVADDSEAIRSLLRALISVEPDLELVGEASDGVEAIELVERERPDVLLLDLAMPNMDGLQVLERLQKSGASTRVVLFTGHGGPSVRGVAAKLGAADYVEKGLPPDELVERLRVAAAG